MILSCSILNLIKWNRNKNFTVWKGFSCIEFEYVLKVVKTLLENKKVFNNFFYLSKSIEREIENDTIVDFLHHFKDTFQTE